MMLQRLIELLQVLNSIELIAYFSEPLPYFGVFISSTMNFIKQDIIDRVGGKILYFRSNAIPLTLSTSVKKSNKHDIFWCSIAGAYAINGTRVDRRAFANLLAEVCDEFDIMFERPNWKNLFKGIDYYL
jgi:hypothetical protein